MSHMVPAGTIPNLNLEQHQQHEQSHRRERGQQGENSRPLKGRDGVGANEWMLGDGLL